MLSACQEGFTETSLGVQAKSVLTLLDFALDGVIAHPMTPNWNPHHAAG
ncbi:hypothetical protein KCP76_06100 [Salmonella enterica subsp. enterica serovar Weltevreden]|nr:hypothetical protein KCP76_06100 [Salmonella enterica subsp. enterica serovar Weltevreden]